MVRLTRIYTRAGDGGQTRLGDGTAVSKDSARVEAYGCVDELNSTLGLVLCESGLDPDCRRELERIQNELFDLGSDLCVPGEAGAGLRIDGAYPERLERAIDRFNGALSPLESFILPGGSRSAAALHLARTVCRRAERRLQTLIHLEGEQVNPQTLVYLNRLSDLLFVLARHANPGGQEVLWVPGGQRD
jgi:cob(I)alamin adenosyltransferase